MTRSLRRLVLVALLASACGSSSSPSSPTPAQPTLIGHVTAVNGGQPLAGLSVAFASQSATTDGGGGFSLTVPNSAPARLTLAGDGILPRSVTAAAGALNVDAIALAGADAEGYRQIAHNTYDGPIQPIRRWTQNPNVYLRTSTDDGAPISEAELSMAEGAIREAVNLWSDGLFTPTFTRGMETRENVAGWITIQWHALPGTLCGQSDVGKSGGLVELNPYRGGGCACGALPVTARVVKHELGHAMGFWHTDNQADLMWPGTPACDQQPSARERQYAHIVYHRPIGNTDPDTDP